MRGVSGTRSIDIYLDDALRRSVERGQHNYIAQVRAAFESAGVRVALREDSVAERLASVARPGYALFHMQEPPHPRALTTRRAYVYPFWRIERTNRRWQTEVAMAAFDPAAIDPDEAARFAGFWRRRLFGAAVPAAEPGGYVYVPLQGRLLERRSFQTVAPIDMLREVLTEVPGRIRVTLHPKEVYAPAELQALDRLARTHPRLELSAEPPEVLLPGCDMVITQNSAVAFQGYFHEKPAVLFARIDFHHIAARVDVLGSAEAIRQAREARPDFARYLYWFLQEMAINAGKQDAPAQILKTVRRRGWDI